MSSSPEDSGPFASDVPEGRSVSWQELLLVGTVGLGVAFAASRIPVANRMPLYSVVAGAGLLTVGYLAASQRPAHGWPGQGYVEEKSRLLLTKR